MKVFDFDPADYRSQYQQQGYVHIREGVTTEFHDYLLKFVAELASHRLAELAGKGNKEQALLEFPDDVDYPGELYDVIAAVSGLNRETMVLSERHIKAYEADAKPEPTAHKDRYPSQVSVGLSIKIPEESTLVLYPHDHVAPNPFNSAAELWASLQPDEQPDVALKNAREVELDDHDRDVLIFPGSATWHLRRRGANAVNLYLKFNDFGSDPLGEDPSTAGLRERTLSALQAGDGLDALVPALSRRLDTVEHVYTRGWAESLQARIYGEAPFGITQAQFEALRLADGRRSLADVLSEVAAGGDVEQVRREVLGLAERGALDLL
ncbi:hypothetical protein ACVGVM_21190 [Pseudonocardia bannensis]|uniref:Uncharacterized protein n=1 Tax=Pseudonocardia bannensis TaxID=630973 RepID=A0A848DEW0_9PSEU|nr:hypothetical protein [Pseudonocardia bannensis]NMH91160.1 hypothetical protein [Pseudonocardia bannensis]